MFNHINLDEKEIKDIFEKKDKIDEFKNLNQVKEFKKRYEDYINKLIKYEKDEKKFLSFYINKLDNEIMDLKYIIKKLENDKVNIENKMEIESMKNNEKLYSTKHENEFFKAKMSNEFLITITKLENERNKKLKALKLSYKKMEIDLEDIKNKKEIKNFQFQNAKDKLNLEFQKESYDLDSQLMDIKSEIIKNKICEELKINKLNNKRIIEREKINGDEKLFAKNLIYNQIKYELSSLKFK